MTDQPKVTIDGREFLLDDLSEDAKEQLASMNIVDAKIADRQQQVAILQTARGAYGQALAKALAEIDPQSEPSVN